MVPKREIVAVADRARRIAQAARPLPQVEKTDRLHHPP